MHGYFSTPAIRGQQVYFISEGDLWHLDLSLPLHQAIRLTQAHGELSGPAIHPEGTHIALTATEEGATEVWVLDLQRGGPMRRLTFDDAHVHVVGWAGDEVIFASDRHQPFGRLMTLWRVGLEGKEPQDMGLGDACWLDTDPDTGAHLLARHRDDLAHWKRYKGGRAGQVWQSEAAGGWHRMLPEMSSGLARPHWCGGRVYFLSDHEDHANLYSVTAQGQDIRRHTHHEGFAVRALRSDGQRFVYARAGELWVYDPGQDSATKLHPRYASTAPWLTRRFVDPQEYLEEYNIHPSGHSLSAVARGRAFTFYLWEGGVRELETPQPARQRFARYLAGGDQVLCVVGDEREEEHLQMVDLRTQARTEVALSGQTQARLGRVMDLWAHPIRADLVAFVNHKGEVGLLDLERGEVDVLDGAAPEPIEEVAWSPCGAWMVWAKPLTPQTSALQLFGLEGDAIHQITTGEFMDSQPCFDPEGRLLYFVTTCNFNPTWGDLYHEMNMLRSQRLVAMTLRRGEPDPFEKRPGKPDDDEAEDEAAGELEPEEPGALAADKSAEDGEDGPLEIDLEGIAARIVALPVAPGRFGDLGANSQRVFYVKYPIIPNPRGGAGGSEEEDHDEDHGTLWSFSLKGQKARRLLPETSSFDLSADGKTLAAWTEGSLRVIGANTPPPDDLDEPEDAPPSRQNGWIDLGRVNLEVSVQQEWRQMFREVWRLMRDQFWTPDMSGIDWPGVYEAYRPCLEGVHTRAEFSDLVRCMQGELGTSHAFEFGGDHKLAPHYPIGHLGATFAWEPTRQCWVITTILQGDSWSRAAASPLARPGMNLAPGDALLRINGRLLSQTRSPAHALVNLAGQRVEVEVLRAQDTDPTLLHAKALHDDSLLRYRHWVGLRRAWVDAKSEGRVGYMHLPDMSQHGYAEFHRAFGREAYKEGLLVDVRYNEGGNVSGLLIEKLAREIVGYSLTREGPPQTYPPDAPRGPMVLLTNEYAGSDGDIFSHMFKRRQMGLTVGQRTWGGVVGIWPRVELVDGSVTTQPEFATWFDDVGFGLENWGMTPDLEVPIPPGPADTPEQDYTLHVALEALMERLIAGGTWLPEKQTWPKLAPRRLEIGDRGPRIEDLM